jgi:hypothetical protein
MFVKSGVFYARANNASLLDDRSPNTYARFVRLTAGGFGWIRKDLLFVLWGEEEAAKLNLDYQIPQYLPGMYVVGSNAGGDAFVIDQQGRILSTPFVGMARDLSQEIAPDFDSLFKDVTVAQMSVEREPLEIAEIKPILFGGDPVVHSNKITMTREKHVQYVRYWNQVARWAKNDPE